MAGVAGFDGIFVVGTFVGWWRGTSDRQTSYSVVGKETIAWLGSCLFPLSPTQ